MGCNRNISCKRRTPLICGDTRRSGHGPRSRSCCDATDQKQGRRVERDATTAGKIDCRTRMCALAVDTFRTGCSVVWCENSTRLSEIFSRQNVNGVVLSGGIESMRATRRPEVERFFRLPTSHSQRRSLIEILRRLCMASCNTSNKETQRSMLVR